VRWSNYILIHNFKPNLWPAGDPKAINKKGELVNAFFDIDDSPSKAFLIENSEQPDIQPYFILLQQSPNVRNLNCLIYRKTEVA